MLIESVSDSPRVVCDLLSRNHAPAVALYFLKANLAERARVLNCSPLQNTVHAERVRAAVEEGHATADLQADKAVDEEGLALINLCLLDGRVLARLFHPLVLHGPFKFVF